MKKNNAVLTSIVTACAIVALSATFTSAQQGNNKDRSSAFGTLGSNKEPIKIDSDRLDVFDKESRAIFTGNVIAVQGESTMKCTQLSVFYDRQKGTGATAPQPPAAPGTNQEQIKKIECEGPVTIVNKNQVATGSHATFDRTANKVYLTGNVTLSEGPNVTSGERVVYNLTTQTANIETTPGRRVRALFVPGSQDGDKKKD